MENYLIEARQICSKFNYCNKIAAEINGKLLYLTEGEIRALQIVAKRKADESDDVFENLIIYYGQKSQKALMMVIFTT